MHTERAESVNSFEVPESFQNKMLSHTSQRKKLSLLLRSTLLPLAWLDFRATLSCQIFEFFYVTNQSTVQAVEIIYTTMTLYT